MGESPQKRYYEGMSWWIGLLVCVVVVVGVLVVAALSAIQPKD